MSRQRGSLRREGKWWVVRYQEGAVRRAVRIGTASEFKTRAAARAKCDQVLTLCGAAAGLTGKSIRLVDYVPAFLSGHAAGIVRRSTEMQWRGTIRNHLLPCLGGLELAAIDTPRVQQFIAELGRKGLSRTRVRNIVQLLRQVLRTATRDGYAAHHIAPFTLRFPKDAMVRPPRRCLTLQDSRRLIEAAEYPMRALYAILAYTGCRIGEALGLTWAHVNYSRAVVHIRQAAVDGRIYLPKTAGSVADLAMPAALAQELQAFRAWWELQRRLDAAPPSSLLFPGRHGGPIRSAGIRQHHLHPLLARLGIEPCGLHAFRHGVATLLFEQGTDPATVQRMLRHSNLRTTMSYAHTTHDRASAAAERLAHALSGAAP
jgi:integrase